MKKPKILFYDIETRPNTAAVWEKYEQNVLWYEDYWQMLSFAYKWQGSKKVVCHTNKKNNDKDLVGKLANLFNEADIIVAHNGDEFDFKKTTARLIYHKLSPVKQVASVDTKKVAKRHFKFNGNSLQDLAEFFGIGSKVQHTGLALWKGCIKNNQACWNMMVKYNKQDVVLLEQVYDRMFPWITNHPNIARIINPDENRLGVCPHCASTKVMKRGMRANRGSLQQQWLCNACGSWFLTRRVK